VLGAAGLAALTATTGFSFAAYPGKANAASRFIWPFPATMRTDGYGARPPLLANGVWTPGWHDGQDFGAGAAGVLGTPVIAAGAGKVVQTFDASNRYWGNRVDIDHGDGLVTIYRHMNVRLANVGNVIAQGQQIGTTGRTGAATGVHLHFQTEFQGLPMDPDSFFTRFNNSVPKPPTAGVEDDMFKIINTAGGDSGVYLIGIRGKRVQIGSGYHIDLLRRVQRQDEYGMTLAEMEIVKNYLDSANS
jgi:murein DD-endopeptidase MepM/ murein hydrolase activator NlpD